MNKYTEIAFLATIAVLYGTVCMTTDLPVFAFSDMKLFFSVSSNTMLQLLSYHFLGICAGGLLLGPLSDLCGRRQILLLGFILFIISSWCCCVINQFDWFVLCRFLQGVGAAALLVITFAIFLEKYESKKVSQLYGIVNIYMTSIMIIAPIIGFYLNIHFGWKSNFVLMTMLAIISFIGGLFFIAETGIDEIKIQSSIFSMIKRGGVVLMRFPCMIRFFICYFLFSGMMMFVVTFSLAS